MKENKILLTISLLVSNRIDTIRKCMESIKPLLVSIPSELIIVDTAGEQESDGSLEIAREYATCEVSFKWCNNFAAARNAGLTEARGEWFMFLDDDEWFEDVTPIIRFFQDGEYKNYDRAWYMVRNYQNAAGTSYVESAVDRMCRIIPELRFKGRIHEYLFPVLPRVMQFFCYVHHYGYVFDEHSKKAHYERNIQLLLQEIEQDPDDARMIGQCVKEYMVEGEYDKARALVKAGIERNENNISNPFVQNLLVCQIAIEMDDNKWERAMELLSAIKEKYALIEAAELSCVARGAIIAARCNNHLLSLDYVKEYFALKSKILSMASDILYQDVFDFKWYRSEECEQKIILQGLASVQEAGKYELAPFLFGRINWNAQKDRPFEQMIYLINIYGKSGIEENFFTYAEQVIENEQMKEPFLISLNGMLVDHPERNAAVQKWLIEATKKERPKSISAEVYNLGKQIKKNINILLECNKIEEAKELFYALKEMIPEDEELMKIRRKLG